MKKNNKILIVIITIVGIGLIISGVALYKYSSNQESNNTQKQETNSGDKKISEEIIELTNEDGSNPYFEISNEIVTLSKEAIPDATKLDFSSETEYFVSLKQLNEKYKIDISRFNTDSITCSIEETGVLFIYTDEEIKRTSRVVCGPPTVKSPEQELQPEVQG